jgi:mannitol/fructose-specific phosphotransferase system IIA component (Ntr-type)
MKLSDYLLETSIVTDVKGRDSLSVIRELGTLLAKKSRVKRTEDLITALVERENLSSTAIGHGIALPHAKTDVIEKLSACVGISKSGIDFKSGDPVKLVFLIAGPNEAVEEHVQLLAVISRLCTDGSFRKRLSEAGSSAEAYQLIKEKESVSA